jgi:protein tyrosine phosphatase (PTP) superfamily phosphohydrolase (DUF442 family)
MKRLTTFALFTLLAACKSAPVADPQQFMALGIKESYAPMQRVYCSGQPTPEQFGKLRGIGITRVVSLRAPTEDGTGWEEAQARELGHEFVRIPVVGEAGLSVDNAKLLARELREAAGPVLVTCNSSNRVGALFALKAHFLDGKSASEAIAEGKACGLSKAEPAVAKMVSE